MKPGRISCPSCGAPHQTHNPGIIMVVCEYCGNALYWDEEQLKNAGKQSIPPEGFTRLYRGASGSLMHKRFLVLGRVRYSFGKGFWDEWYVELQSGATGWLTEDNHELAIEKAVPKAAVPAYASLRPGSVVEVQKTRFIIEEVGNAACIGVEGDLPRAIQTGETYPYADGSSPDGRFSLGIEYDDDPPAVFRGQWIKYASMRLDDEGLDW